jgi:hypothetical protein
MNIIDRIKGLFGGTQSGAEYGTVTGGSVAATENDDSAGEAGSQSGSGWSGESGGDGGGGGGDGGGGGGGGT